MNSSKDTLPSMPASVSAAAAMTRATSSTDQRQYTGDDVASGCCLVHGSAGNIWRFGLSGCISRFYWTGPPACEEPRARFCIEATMLRPLSEVSLGPLGPFTCAGLP